MSSRKNPDKIKYYNIDSLRQIVSEIVENHEYQMARAEKEKKEEEEDDDETDSSEEETDDEHVEGKNSKKMMGG